MLKYYYSSEKFIHYTDQGDGLVLCFIHGYLENESIFSSITKQMSRYCRCISIDIPGHGLSCVQDNLSMDSISILIKSLMESLNIDKFSLIGHSMGGYVALAYAELYPESLNSIVLVHSSANADSEDKKNRRRKEINLIRNGMKDFICAYSIPSIFYDKTRAVYEKQILNIVSEAKKNSDQGVISALYCMTNRKDKNKMLENLFIPKFLFLGKYDTFIDCEKARLEAYSLGMQVFVFDHSAHVCFIEEELKCLSLLRKLCLEKKK